MSQDAGAVLSLELAQALRATGLAWTPRPGDRFAVPGRDLDGQVFVISDMVISSVEVPFGPTVLAFNGTTEWALDSLEVDQACWLPREDQLRDRLGEVFVSLERLGPGAGTTGGTGGTTGTIGGTRTPDGYVVTLTDGSRHLDLTPDAAYARALLAHLARPGG